MASAFVYNVLPIRGAAMKQLMDVADPASVVDGKEEEAEPEIGKKNVTKRKSTAKAATPKKTPSKAVFRETPPTSPEPEEKDQKKKKGRGKGKKAPENRKSFDRVIKELVAKKTPKRRSTAADAEAAEDPLWFDGVATPEDISIEKLKFKPGMYFIGRYKILYVVEIDEEKGATFIAYRDKYEVVLRVNFIQKDDMKMVTTEAKFLEMMELNAAQHFFSTFYDMGTVNMKKADGMAFYAVLFRAGVTLQQCHGYCKTLRSDTVDRLASQMAKILEQIFGHGYRILSLSLDDFKIDYRSRLVFLQNYTNIVRAEGIDLRKFEAELGEKTKGRMAWEGSEDYAPVRWHLERDDHVMSEMDAIESLIYMLIQLHIGALPWTNTDDKMALKLSHSELTHATALINRLPPSLKTLWSVVRSSESPRVNYSFINDLFTRYADENQDFFYDWESPSPSVVQQKLICLSNCIEDTKVLHQAASCIFDNEMHVQKNLPKKSEGIYDDNCYSDFGDY